ETRWGSNAKSGTGSPNLLQPSAPGGSVEIVARVYGIVPAGQLIAAAGGYTGSIPVSVVYQEGHLADCDSLTGSPVTSSLPVSAQVQANCPVEAEDINFGMV